MNEKKTTPNKQTQNRREHIIGFVHVSLFFIVTTIACCFIFSYYSNNNRVHAKERAIQKMNEIRKFRTIQNEQTVEIDSVFSIIENYNPTIQASYKENDIKIYLNNIKSFYEKSDYEKRYKVFYQTVNFYNMWFADKQELWSKRQNINDFKKNWDDCKAGIQKKQEQLKNNIK